MSLGSRVTLSGFEPPLDLSVAVDLGFTSSVTHYFTELEERGVSDM